VGYGEGACSKAWELENAHRTVPDDRACLGDFRAKSLHGLGTNIQDPPTSWHVAYRQGFHVRFGVELVTKDHIHWQDQFPFRFREQSLGGVDHFRFHERVSHLITKRFQEGVCHASADQDLVGFLEQVFDHADLVRDLRTAQNGNKGTLRVGNRVTQVFDFLFHQEASR